MILNIDDDLADKITVNNLLESLQICREQSAELMEKEVLENYEAIDLANHIKDARTLESALAYFLDANEYELRVGKKFPK